MYAWSWISRVLPPAALDMVVISVNPLFQSSSSILSHLQDHSLSPALPDSLQACLKETLQRRN